MTLRRTREHKLIGAHAQRLRKLFNYVQADIALTVFEFAEISPLYARFEGELLLSPATFVANLSHSYAKNLCKPHARRVVRSDLGLYPL